MRILTTIITTVLLFLLSNSGQSAVVPLAISDSSHFSEFYKKVNSFKTRAIKKMVGRKLTLKEKISLLIIRKRVKQGQATNKLQGSSAILLAVGSLILLGVAIAIGISAGPGFVAPFIIVLLASLVGAGVVIKKTERRSLNEKDKKKAAVARIIASAVILIIAGIGLVAIVALSN